MARQSNANVRKGGRPAKFDEPSRVVTLTLPERILERLSMIDGDRAKAIVKAADAIIPSENSKKYDPIRELSVEGDRALLIVPNCRQLRSIPWLTLIEISPGRNLISLQAGIPIEKLEVTLGDLLDAKSDITEIEKNIVSSLLQHLRTPRRNKTVQKEEILVIDKA